jgi:hypothetical protein
MKKLIILSSLVYLFAVKAQAQTADTYYLGRTSIALVLVTHEKEYLLDTSYYRLIKPKWIKGAVLDVLRPNPNDTLKYGHDAINGVNKIIIDDKHYPNAYLTLLKGMKYVGPANP